jgi:predicted membrane protein
MSEDRRDRRKERWEERREEWKMRWEAKMERGHRHGHIWTGALLLLIGGVALARNYVPEFPNWVFTWQMLLITLGLFIGIRHRFHGMAWFILLLIGGTFLANEYILTDKQRITLWPVILIAIGLFFIFRSRSGPGRHCFQKKNSDGKQGNDVNEKEDTGNPFIDVESSMHTSTSEDDFIDTTSIFGGAKKIILTKNFKGGDIVNIFGGTELNLTQADINGTAVLELTTIFGGTKLVIPSNWSVKSSEVVTIFGGIEDKRQMSAATTEVPEKTLVLKGTVVFGGIDIKSS